MTRMHKTKDVIRTKYELEKRLILLKNSCTSALLAVFIIMTVLSCSSKGKMYQAGDTIQPFNFKNAANNESLLRGEKLNVILFSKFIEEDALLLKYIDRIFQDKYKNMNLDIFLIAETADETEADPGKKYDISLPILPFNKNKKFLQRFFDTAGSDRALIIIEPGLKFDAVYHFFKEEDVRQLFEKYLTGSITYSSDVKLAKLAAGDPFPPVIIARLAAQQKDSLADTSKLAPRLWFIFGSKCVSCALNNYLLQFKLVEKRAAEQIKIPGSLLFSRYFREEEISERIKFYKIDTPVYLAKEEIAGFENAYYKDAAADSILVVATGKSNNIVYIKPFPDFVMDFEGGKIEQKLDIL